MKKKELKQFREKSLKEMRDFVDKNSLKSLEVKAKTKVGKQKNLKKYKILKRDLAQANTLIKEKEILRGEKDKEGEN